MPAKPEPQCDNGRERSSLRLPSMLSAGHTTGTPLRLLDRESAELLHELNNVFVSMLLNAQVMEWKLPSYSRLKRNLHEVQRNAQRGGELTKRLLDRLETMSRRDAGAGVRGTGTSDSVVAECAVADQEPGSAIRCEDDPANESPRCPAPDFSASSKKVPHTPV